MDNLKAYYMKEDYINYLSKYDNKVPFNKNQTRPYVGIVIERNGVSYFAPLSSPKPKHKLMKNGLDIFKIKSGELGIINLNNMIPVKSDNIIKIDFDDKPITYKNLINNQIQFINNNKSDLLKKVEKLFKLYERNSIPRLTDRCCNFTLLEKKCLEYNQLLIKSIESTSRQEVAATISDVTEATIKDKIINLYKDEFQPIRHISEKTAQNINKLNLKNGQPLKIKEINSAYIKAGKNLEIENTQFNRKLFNELEEIHSDLNQCKHKENQIQAHEKVKANVPKIDVPEI